MFYQGLVGPEGSGVEEMDPATGRLSSVSTRQAQRGQGGVGN